MRGSGYASLTRGQIQPAVVYAEPGSAIFLSHQHHRCRTRTVPWFDLSPGQHFLNTAFLLFNLLRRHTSWGAPDGRGVAGIDGLFHSVCVSGQSGARYGETVHKVLASWLF